MAMGINTIIDQYNIDDLKEFCKAEPKDYSTLNSDVKRIFHNLTMQELRETNIPLSRWQWIILSLPSFRNFSLFTIFYQEQTFRLTAAAVDNYITKQLNLKVSSEHIEKGVFEKLISHMEIDDKLDLYENPTRENLQQLLNRFFPELQDKKPEAQEPQAEVKEQQAEVKEQQAGAKERARSPSIEEIEARRKAELQEQLQNVKERLTQKEKELQNLEAEIQSIEKELRLKKAQKIEIATLRSQESKMCKTTYDFLWKCLSLWSQVKLKKATNPRVADIDFLLNKKDGIEKEKLNNKLYFDWIDFCDKLNNANKLDNQLIKEIEPLQKQKEDFDQQKQSKQLELQQEQEQEKKLLEEMISEAYKPSTEQPTSSASVESPPVQEIEQKERLESQTPNEALFESIITNNDYYKDVLRPLLVKSAKLVKLNVDIWEKSFFKIGEVWTASPQAKAPGRPLLKKDEHIRELEDRIADGSIYESMAKHDEYYKKELRPLMQIVANFLEVDKSKVKNIIREWEKSLREIGNQRKLILGDDPQKFSQLSDQQYSDVFKALNARRVLSLKKIMFSCPKGMSIRDILQQIQKAPALQWRVGIHDLEKVLELGEHVSLEDAKKWLADKVFTASGEPLSDVMYWVAISLLRALGKIVNKLNKRSGLRFLISKIPTSFVSLFAKSISGLISSELYSIPTEEELFLKLDPLLKKENAAQLKIRKKFDDARVEFFKSVQSKFISEMCRRNLDLFIQMQEPISNAAIYSSDKNQAQAHAVKTLCQTTFNVLQQFSQKVLEDSAYIALIELSTQI